MRLRSKEMRILILIVALLLSGCVQKQKTEDLNKVTLKKLYTIEGHSAAADPSAKFSLGWNEFLADKDGYCYIIDDKTGSIKVFDKTGKFYSSISGNGIGPEEIEFFNAFYVIQDTLFISDKRIKVKKFMRNGKYVGVKNLDPEVLTLLNEVYALNDSTLLTRYQTFKKGKNDVEINHYLSISDIGLNKKIDIYEGMHTRSELNIMSFIEPVFAFSNEEVFVSNRSKSDYKIKIFSHDGSHLRTITNNYMRTKYSEEEMKIIIKIDDREEKHIRERYDFKPSLIDMFCDKNGYLWVQRNVGFGDSDINFDIFDNDTLKYRFDFKNKKGQYGLITFYIKNYLYLIDTDNNLIEVYDFKIGAIE
jgi:hypothetical protein